MIQRCFYKGFIGISWIFSNILNVFLICFQGWVKFVWGISGRGHQGCFRGVLRVFHKVSRLFHSCLKEALFCFIQWVLFSLFGCFGLTLQLAWLNSWSSWLIMIHFKTNKFFCVLLSFKLGKNDLYLHSVSLRFLQELLDRMCPWGW